MGGDKSVPMVSLPGGRSTLSSRVKGVHFRTRMLRRDQRAAQSSPPPLKCLLPAGSTELKLSGLVLWASLLPRREKPLVCSWKARVGDICQRV